MKDGLRRKGKTLGTLLVAALVWAGAPAAASQDAPIADAAMRDDTEAVRSLIAEGADVNVSQGDGTTALHWAAKNGNLEMIDVLTYAGAYPEAVTRNGGYTPLHLAARAGEGEAVAKLLEAGADPNAGSSTDVAALHFAAAAGSGDAIRALIDHGADVDARESAQGQTPLIFAAAGNRPRAVAILMESGADPGLSTRVIDLVAREEEDRRERRLRNERLELLQELEEEEAAEGENGENGEAESTAREDAEDEDDGEEVRENEDEETNEEAADAMTEEEEEENPYRRLSYAEQVEVKGGMTPLLHAARQGHIAVADALLDAGADVDRASADGTTPLLIATMNGHFDLAKKLVVEHGADPTRASDAGATPLYTTLNLQWHAKSYYPHPRAYLQQETDYLELMELFLEEGADPNVRLKKRLWYSEYNVQRQVNTTGATPFWRAAYGTDVDAMKLLLEYGADPTLGTLKVEGRRSSDPDEEDPSGLEPVEPGEPAVLPIHAASGVGYGHSRVANHHRHAPEGWLPAVKFLVEEVGVDVNARDENGYNAVHHAASRGDDELIRYLVEQGADVTAVSRSGQTTVDMANGPIQRISPYPGTIELLEGLGARNNHNCVSC